MNILPKQAKKDNLLCRVLVGVNFIARPTSIIPWVLIWPYELIQRRSQKIISLIKLVLINVVTLVLMVLFSVLVDVLYFKKLTWSALNFLQFNLIESGAELYGVHENFWYITQGIPYLFLTFIVYLGYGIYVYIKQKKQVRLFLYLIFPILFISISKHKEDRFLLPLFPLFYIFINIGISKLKSSKFLILAIIPHLALFLYLGVIHQ